MPQTDGVEHAAGAENTPAGGDGTSTVAMDDLRFDRAVDSDGLIDEAGFRVVEAELAEAGRWADLAHLYDVGIEHAPDPDVGRGMILDAGLLNMEKLGDRTRAERYFRRMLATDPGDFEGLHAHATLTLLAQRYDEAADLLDGAIAAAPDPMKPDLCLAVARVAAEHLDDADRAVDALMFAHEIDPSRLDVLELARDILWSDGHLLGIGAVLDAEAQARFGADGQPEQPSTASRALADAYRHLGIALIDSPLAHDEARRCLERARALGDNDALSKLDDLASFESQWKDRAEAFEADAMATRDKRAAASQYVRAAEAHLAFGNDRLKSDEVLNRALILCPDLPAALAFIERAHADDPEGLQARLRSVADGIRDVDAKVAIYERAIGIANATGEHEAAMALHRVVLESAPHRRASVVALSAYLGDEGAPTDRAAILQKYLEAATRPNEKVEALLALGGIEAEELGQSDAARAHFEQVLELRGDDFHAARALRALYTDANEPAKVLEVLKILVDFSPDVFSRLDVLGELAAVAAEVGPEPAFDAHRRIFALDPNAKDAQAKLEGLAAEVGRLDVLASTLSAAARRQPAERAAELWRAAGTIYHRQIERPSEAAAAYRQVLALAPDDDATKAALAEILAEGDDPAGIVEGLEAELAGDLDDEAKAPLLAKLGRLLDELGEVPKAVDVFETLAALGQAAYVGPALSSLEALHEKQQAWAELAKVLERVEAAAEDPTSRAAARARRAEVLHAHLGEREQAAELYLASIEEAEPSDAMVADLHKLLIEGVATTQIAAALAPHFARSDQPNQQVEMLEVLVADTDAGSQRAQHGLTAAAVAADRLADPGRALELYGRALAADPSSDTALDGVAELAVALGRQGEVADWLTAILDREGLVDDIVTGIALALGDVLESDAEQSAASIDAYQRALSADGGNAAAAAALERLLGADGRYEALAELLESLVEGASTPASKTHLCLRLATVRAEHLDDLDGAEDACRTALAAEPGSSVAYARLIEVLEQQAAHGELVEALGGMRAATEDTAVRAALDARAGDVLRIELSEPKEALDRYAAALQARNDNPEAISGLQALLQEETTAAEAAALLNPMLAGAGLHSDRVAVLQQQLEETDDPSGTLIEIATVQLDQLNDAASAWLTLDDGFDRLDDAALQQAARVAQAAGTAPELAAKLAAKLEGEDADPKLILELARLYEGPAANLEEAAKQYQRLVDRDDADADALAALERLRAAGDDPAALAEVLLQRVDTIDDAAEQVAVAKRAAAIYEELVEDLAKAAEALERARAIVGDDRSTLFELERLYRKLDDAEKLSVVLIGLAACAGDDAERAAVLVRLAQAHRGLGDDMKAAAALADAADLAPGDEAVRAALEGLLDSSAGDDAAAILEPIYRRSASWSKLVEVYERLADATDIPAERLERLVAIRSTYEERLNDAPRAFNAGARAYQAAPEDDDVLSALERLAVPADAVDELVALLEDRADAAEGEARYRVRHRVARFCDQIDDKPQALAAWRNILEERAGDLAALEAVVRLSSDLGDEEAMVVALEALADVQAEPEAKAEHLLAAARILEGRPDGRDKAIEAYEQVRTLAPDDRGSLVRLDALYTASRDHDHLRGVLSDLIERSEGKDRAVLRLRLGRLLHGVFEEFEPAVDALSAVVESGGEGSEPALEGAVDTLDEIVEASKTGNAQLAARAAEIIEPYWVKTGNHLKVVAAKEARAAALDDPGARRATLVEIAKTYEIELGEPQMAFLAMTRAYRGVPGDPTLGAELERLAPLAEATEELADLFSDAIDAIDDQTAVLELSRRVAHLYDHELGRGAAAVPHYERIHSMEPQERDVLEALERIHGQLENNRGAVWVLREQLSHPDADKPALYAKIAALLDGPLEDSAGALDAWRSRVALNAADTEALVAMAVIAERERDGDVLVEALSQHAAASEGEEQASLHVRVGVTQRDLRTDPAAAVVAFAAALAASEQHPGAIQHLSALAKSEGPAQADAAAVLAPIYKANGAFSDYVACVDARLSASNDPEARKGFLLDIAEVYETNLGRPELAFTYACRAMGEDIRDLDVRQQAERLAKENDLLEDIAEVYLDAAEGDDDVAVQVDLRRRVAQLYDSELGDTDRAIDQHMKVLEVAPGDTETLHALERLYRLKGSFGELAEIFRRRIAQSEDPRVRAVLMRELARIQADQLDDASGAIATLRRLLEVEPDDIDALQRLALLCQTEGRYSELSDVLERLIGSSEEGGDTQLEAKLELARIKLDELTDRDGAFRLFREILSAKPKHDATRRELRARLEDALDDDHAKTAIQVASILAAASRASEEWQTLIELRRVEVNLAAAPHERVPLNLEIAELYRDHLAQPELAFAALSQAFRDAPTDETIRGEMEQLAADLLMVEDLVEAYGTAVETIPDPESKLSLMVRIAELLEKEVGDRNRAAEAWEAVLSKRPMDGQATAALDRIYVALGRWAALTDILDKRVELAADDPAMVHELHMRLGAIWQDRLGEDGEALISFRAARQVAPKDPETLRALARLLDDERDPDELHAVLSGLVEQTEEPRALVRLLPPLANLTATRFERISEAIDLWERVVELEPGHTTALQQLEKLYEREGRWAQLAELLERQLRVARDDAEIVRLQRRLGLIKGTRLDRVDEAVAIWTQILKRNPNDVEALEALRKIYRAAERWSALVSTLRKLVPLQSDAEGVKALRFELAELFLTNLGRRDEAIESAKRVLDVEPLTVAELMRLEEIFIAAEAFADAIRVMNTRAERTEDPGERADILFAVAALYESKLGRRAHAAASYERILDASSSNTKAYDALAGIYESSGDFRKLVELHNRRLDSTEDAEERRQLLFEIIDIQEKRLGHREFAFVAACRAFADEGADPQAQAIAERLAEETEAWEELVDVYEEAIDELPLPRALELRRRTAQIYLDKLDEPARAERHLDLVLTVRPEETEARAEMGRLLQGQGRWRDLCNLILDQIDHTEDIDATVALFLRIAGIEELKLNEPDSAIATLRRAAELDPTIDEPLAELSRLLRSTEQWRPLAEVLSRRAGLAEADEDRAARKLELAAVWDECIDDVDEAVAGYREVLELDPANLRALKALEHLYAESSRWHDLLDVYEQQVLLAPESAIQIDVLHRIARVKEKELEDITAAAEDLVRALHIEPSHLPTVRELERLWAATNDDDKLVEAYQRHLEVIDDPDEKIVVYVALGETEARRPDASEPAEAAFKAALELDPDCEEAVHGLGALYEADGNWFSALEMLQREASIVGQVPSAVELHFRAGNIHENMLMDRAAAKASYAHAIQVDSAYTPALRALAEIYREEENWADVVRLEAQIAKHTDDAEERAKIYVQAAATALDRLDSIDAAIRLYERSLEAVSDHLPAARALSDLYFVAEEWERAERLLELLVERLDRQMDAADVCRQYYRLAYIAEKLGDDARALQRYLSSYEVDATYLPTLEGLATALLRSERWDDAQRIFQSILVHHRDDLTDAEVVELYFSLGELAVKLQDTARARRSFDSGLELDPYHADTLRAYADLCESIESWEEAYDHRNQLIEQLHEDDRLQALLHQAELCVDVLDDPYRAIDAYAQAREIAPDNAGVLRPLMSLYRRTGQFGLAVDAGAGLAKAVVEPAEKVAVYTDLATIHADERRDWSRAADALNAALDIDPHAIAAFAKLEALLAKFKKWPVLEENYRRMIGRLPKDSRSKQRKVVLWRALGDLHREVFKNRENALTAYRVAFKLAPEQYDLAQLLGKLLAEKRGTVGEAVKIYTRLVPLVDNPDEPVRNLWPLYYALKERDQTLGALGALALMGVAKPDEVRLYENLLKRGPQAPSQRLNDRLWTELVFHKNCRNSIANILSVLYRAAPELFEGQQLDLKLDRRKERVDVNAKGKGKRGGLRYFSIWRDLANVMDVGSMEHFHRVNSATAPRLYPGEDPVLFAGREHAAFRELPSRQIVFTLARQMTAARSELAPVVALPAEDVGAAVEAAIRLWLPEGSGIDLAISEPRIQKWGKDLRRFLKDKPKLLLKEPVLACVQRQEMRRLTQFLEGVEHTANRAALLLSGDVRVAIRGLSDSQALVDVNPRRRRRELMFFLLHEDFIRLRQHLGLSIKVSQDRSRADAR